MSAASYEHNLSGERLFDMLPENKPTLDIVGRHKVSSIGEYALDGAFVTESVISANGEVHIDPKQISFFDKNGLPGEPEYSEIDARGFMKVQIDEHGSLERAIEANPILGELAQVLGYRY